MGVLRKSTAASSTYRECQHLLPPGACLPGVGVASGVAFIPIQTVYVQANSAAGLHAVSSLMGGVEFEFKIT